MIDVLWSVGVPHLIFTGGEPTLYAELAALVDHANRRGAVCGLNTNGRRLADERYVRELTDAGLDHVQITLASHRPDVHNRIVNAPGFRQTVQGIENALRCGLHTITNTTLMWANADRIEETLVFLHGLGVRTFAVNGMIRSGGGTRTGQAIPEQRLGAILAGVRDRAAELGLRFLWYTPTQYCRLSPIELEIGVKRCNAGQYSVCVEPNGDVLPCQSYYVAAGNLLRDRWEAIWNSPLFRSFRERITDPQAHGLPQSCWQCPELPICGGGCRLEREAARGGQAVRCGSVLSDDDRSRRSRGRFASSACINCESPCHSATE
jgi:radical SAM protein with 4Fe4S-binding SPASM domain